MNSIKNFDAARRLACSLRAATRASLGWFIEGFDTADLKNAKPLLDELSTVQAEGCFQRAIEIARQQSAKCWELRATMSLARLFCDTNRRDEARTMLAEIYNWFTEGFDTRDLQEAKQLLNELDQES